MTERKDIGDDVLEAIADSEPLIGHFINSSNIVYSKSDSLGGVYIDGDKINLKIGLKQFNKLYFEQKVGLIIHEYLHILLGHHKRTCGAEKSEWHRKTFNLGADIVINDAISSQTKWSLPDGAAYSKTFKLPSNKAMEFYIKELRGMISPAKYKTTDDHDDWGDEDDFPVQEIASNFKGKLGKVSSAMVSK